MRNKEEVEAVIEHYKEKKTDHHILLNTPLVRQVIYAHLDTIIATLEWVLEDSVVTVLGDVPQSSEGSEKQ